MRTLSGDGDVRTIAGMQGVHKNVDGCGKIAPKPKSCIIDELLSGGKSGREFGSESESEREDSCSRVAPKLKKARVRKLISDCGSGRGSESESELDGLALFGKLAGVTTLGKNVLVADTKHNRVVKLECRKDVAYETPQINYLTKSVGVPNGPIGMASDGSRFVYTTTSGGIYEFDGTRKKTKARLIAGSVLKDGSDSDSCSGYDSDSDSDSAKKTGREPLTGLCEIAHTVEKENPTLYYAKGNSVKRLTFSEGSWTDNPFTMQSGGKPVELNNPRWIAIEEKDGKRLMYFTEQDKTDIKVVNLDTLEVDTIKTEQLPDSLGAKIERYEGIAVKKQRLMAAVPQNEVVQAGNVPVGGGAGDVTVTAVTGILDRATTKPASNNSDEAGEQEFKFGLSSEQIMLTMRQRGVNFAESSSNDPYSRALNALEKVVDSTQAIKQIGKGMTFWVSGLYTQGQLASMFGNPAMKLKHYGIMAGTHYKDAATQQIFGVAVNVGFGNSISRSDRDLRTDNKAAQITIYYNKKFDEHWKFGWHNTLMRSMDRHQRPIKDAAGNNTQIAISNGVTYEFSSSMEVSYKHEFTKDNYIKPFTAISYTSNKEMAYQEKNVGILNKSYDSAGMEQIGLQFGIKSSIGHQISDTKTFVIMPKLAYTNFVKMGVISQKSTTISSGQQSIGKSGTPGRHLISATLGAGVVDYEASTTTRFSYTGSVQKQKRNHEFLLDWGMKF